mgnify:CR=1 FL=1
MKVKDKQLLKRWERLVDDISKATPVNNNESYQEQQSRIKHLESEPESWFKYYFPNFAYSDPAKFHKKATRRLLKHKRWFEGRAWSRELAKSVRTMMETLYMALTGEVKNVLLVSKSFDNANELLMPFMANLESNQRIINDYGIQKRFGSWEEGKFVTTGGVSFRAIGAGQSPRGTRNDEVRPDMIIIDDLEDDEIARNEKRQNDQWKWIEEALIPTVSVSGNIRVVFLGNIISKNGVMARAKDICDKFEVINIRDNDGKSTWPEKNSEEHIDWILSKISYIAQQKEYFNNPISEGTVFKDVAWGKVPPLNQFTFLVAYGDPAPSNKENKQNCHKALPLIGHKDGTFYVIKCFLEQVSNATFVRWFWDLQLLVDQKAHVYNYIENNTLQDPFYEQVFLPLFKEQGDLTGLHLFTTPDDRKKPDKFTRIEGNLEPLNRLGKLVLNEKEKGNPHMKRLEEQFKAVEPTLSAPVDGPDAVEGGVWIIQNKLRKLTNKPVYGSRKAIKRHSSKHF